MSDGCACWELYRGLTLHYHLSACQLSIRTECMSKMQSGGAAAWVNNPPSARRTQSSADQDEEAEIRERCSFAAATNTAYN